MVFTEWIKKHLNISLILFYFIGMIVAIPLHGMGYIMILVVAICLSVWVLKQKGRSMHWLWIIPVIIYGQASYPPLDIYMFMGGWLAPILLWICLRNKKNIEVSA